MTGMVAALLSKTDLKEKTIMGGGAAMCAVFAGLLLKEYKNEMTEDFFSIFSRFLGWENIGNVFGTGKEAEARTLGASIK